MGIQVKDMSKVVDGLLILNDINLEIDDQRIYGLIGQNDSGKTTLMRILANLRYATEGYLEIDEKDIVEDPSVVKKVYFQSQDNIYPKSAKLKHIMKWTSQCYPDFMMHVFKGLIEKYELDLNAHFHRLSIQKQMIFRSCLAFSVDTDYLLLDEPTFSLDATHRFSLYQDLQASFRRHPKTIILSTHSIDEIESLVEKVIIMEDGQVIVHDYVSKLVDEAYMIEGEDKFVRDFVKQRNIIGQIYQNGYLQVCARLTEEEVYAASDYPIDVRSLNLQELFIHITRNVNEESEALPVEKE